MIIYFVDLSKKYGFFTYNNLAMVEALIEKIIKNQLSSNDTLPSMHNSLNKKIGNVCPIEDLCFSIAIDSYAKQVLGLKETCIPIEDSSGYEFVIPKVMDVLDIDNSEIDFFSGTKKIKRIRKHVFHANMLKNVELFILPNYVSSVMCTESFYNRYVENKLTGISFQKIFSN